MHRKTGQALLLGTLAAALVLGPACRRDPEQSPAENVFAFPMAEPKTLDPSRIQDNPARLVGRQLFEPLVAFDQTTGKVVPGQATRWEVWDDGRTWTFTLRKDARWSDGTPVTAADHMLSFERGKTMSPLHQKVERAEALGEHSLRVVLKCRAAYALELLTEVAFAPVPKHVVEKHGDDWTRPENIATNGPFRLAEHKPGERLVLVRSPGYWDAANVRLDRVVVHVMAAEKAAYDWYERDKVQWTCGNVLPEVFQSLLRQRRTDLTVYQNAAVYFLHLRTTRPPLDDVRVRRALNMAIDKGRLARQVLGMGQEPAAHLVPPIFEASRGYGENPGDRFDPEAARALLAEAGYGPGRPLPALELVTNEGEGHKRIAELVQRSLRENLGVEVTISLLEWKVLLQRLSSGEFHLGRMSWTGDYPDPEAYLEVLRKGSDVNFSQYDAPDFGAALDALCSAGDPLPHYTAAEKALNRDVPIIPLYFHTVATLLRPNVRGLPPEPFERYGFKHVRLER